MTEPAQAQKSTTPSQSLAEWATNLGFDQIPGEVIESAKWRLLDILGICVAAREERGPKALRSVVRSWGGNDQAESVGWGDKLPAANAALVNGTLAHSLDFDDTHHEVRIHASTVVIPTALAAAQHAGLSGREFLVAAVVGFESLVHIGLVAPARPHERGLHATSLKGTLAAALLAAKAYRLASKQAAMAVGIAGSQASGLRESYLGEATDTKGLHAGWASHAGILAAQLGAAGFTGPRTVLEGRFGFYNAFVSPDPWQIERLTEGLGTIWHTPEIVYKLFPCGSLIHGAIDAALALRERHEVDPSTIEEVVCVVAPGMVSTVCEPVEQKLNPESGYQAKFSMQYAVAAALLDGKVTRDSYSDERVSDPELRSLLARTRYETDDSLPFPSKYPGWVRVRLGNGEWLEERTPNSPGSIDKPATRDDIVRKFHGNTERFLSESRRQEVIDRVMSAEGEGSIDRIVELCRQQ